MTSGKTRPWRRGSLLAVAALVLPASPWAAGWDVPRLMALLGSTPHPRAWFDEVKQIGILQAPLEQSGTLEYREPDYLKKHVVVPEEQIFEIDGDRVRLVQPDLPAREAGLGEFPALGAFAEGFRAVLAGDRDGLERHYQLSLAGEEQNWTLTLTPRDQRVAAYVTALEFQGRGGRVDRLRIDERGGDSSVISIRALP